jgi:hypothetical protein
MLLRKSCLLFLESEQGGAGAITVWAGCFQEPHESCKERLID